MTADNRSSNPISPAEALLQAICPPEFLSPISTLADFTIGTSLPTVLVESLRLPGAVKRNLEMQQMSRFLEGLERSTPEDRYKFMQKFGPKARERFAVNLLLKISTADDIRKSRVIGRLLDAMILSDLPSDRANRLIEGVRRAYWEDLIELSTFRAVRVLSIEDHLGEALAVCGLVAIQGSDLGGFWKDEPPSSRSYKLTELGRQLLEFGGGFTED